MHLYFGVRDECHVYDERPLQLLASRHRNLRIETVLSEPSGESARRKGTLADALLQDLEAHRGAQFYVAGPPEMVSSVTQALTAASLAREQIHADPFHVTGQDAAPESAERARTRNFGKLLGGMRGLLAPGRLRHAKGATALSPAKILEEPMAEEEPPQAANGLVGRT